MHLGVLAVCVQCMSTLPFCIPRCSNVILFTEAVPKRILDLMNVEGLTRENVASHLQVLHQLHIFLCLLTATARI